MFQGAYDSIYSNSLADFGAKRTLSTGGSLMQYIHTGNAYNGRQRKLGLNRDGFYSQNPKKRFDKLATFIAISATGIFALYKLIKKGKIDKIPAKLSFNKVKNYFSNINIQSALGTIKDKTSNIFKKTSNESRIIFDDIHNTASRTAKKAVSTESAKEFFEKIKNKA